MGGKKADSRCQPAFEKFGGGWNEQKGSEAWRGLAWHRPRAYFPLFHGKSKATEHLKQRERG